MFIVHTGVCPAAWHPLSPLGSATREEAEDWGPGRSAHSPGLAWRGPLPSSALPPGTTLHSSSAHSCILLASREPALRALWGQEVGGTTLGGGRRAQGRHGGTTVRQTGRGDPGAGPGLRCAFHCSGVPLRGHLGSRNPASKLALSRCQGLWGTHWTRGVWGDTVRPRGLGGTVSLRGLGDTVSPRGLGGQ